MPVDRQLQRMRIGFDRLVQKPLLSILGPQRDIIERKFGMEAQACRREIGGCRLRLLPCRFGGAAHTPPEIDLVIEIDGCLEVTERRRIAQRDIGLMRGSRTEAALAPAETLGNSAARATRIKARDLANRASASFRL